MNKPDLDTVTARRVAVASELASLERMRVEIETEDQELEVAQRVLKRLADITPDVTSSSGSAEDAVNDANPMADQRPLAQSAGR